MIKGVLFDMDGLLINSEPLWRKAEQELFKKVDITLNDDMCFQTVGLRIDEVVEYWFQKFPWENYSKAKLANEIIDRVIELILAEAELLPGVLELFDFFSKKSMPLGIASASSLKIIESVVKKFNLQSQLQVIHSAEKELFGKPHPAVYLSAAQLLKVDAKNILVFEDSINGIIAARAARMKVVAVPEDIHRGELHFHVAHKILHDLTQFNETLFKELNELP